MNNSEQQGQWEAGRERSRVKDNVTLWLGEGGGRMLMRCWSNPLHRVSAAVCQFRSSRYLLHFSLKDWNSLGCGRASRMVSGRLFHQGIMQSS